MQKKEQQALKKIELFYIASGMNSGRLVGCWGFKKTCFVAVSRGKFSKHNLINKCSGAWLFCHPGPPVRSGSLTPLGSSHQLRSAACTPR